jgi:hypothetical protein
LLNALWIVCWHYGRLPLPLITKIILQISLIAINQMIKNITFGIIKASFGIYLRWICIAIKRQADYTSIFIAALVAMLFMEAITFAGFLKKISGKHFSANTERFMYFFSQ